MRLHAIVREAYLNLITGANAVLSLVIVVAVLGTTLSCLDAASVGMMYRTIEQYSASGADIRTVVAKNRIDGVSCDQLSSRADTTASGAVLEAPSVRLLAAPDVPLMVYNVSSGFSQMVLTHGDNSAMVMSDELAARLGLTIGSEVWTNAGSARLSGTYDWPEDGRDSRLQYAVLAVVPSSITHFDECWAKMEPGHGQAYYSELLTTAVFAQSNADVAQYGQVNNLLGKDISPSRLINSRITRPAPIIALVVASLIGVFSVRRKKLTWASDLHAGARHSDILAIICLESLFTALMAATISISLEVLIIHIAPGLAEARRSTIAGAMSIVALVIGYPLGALLMAFLVRESSLYDLFKNR